MNANRLILVAAALALVACSDNYQPALTEPTALTPPAAAAPQRIHGTVVMNQDLGGLSLQTETGLISIQGPVADAMASVNGADVFVVGTYDAAFGLLVDSFEVIAVHGQPALDGYLRMDDHGNLTILLPNDELVPLENPSEALRAYIGQRIWLVLGTDGAETEFGAITIPAADPRRY